MRETIYTVFPKAEGEMPTDFESWQEADAFGMVTYGPGNYIVASTR